MRFCIGHRCLPVILLSFVLISDLWPRTAEACRRLADEFKQLAGIDGCVGALDGTLLPIWRPSWAIDEYFCRKQFHAMNFQVVCDARKRILCGGGFPGTVWDGNAAEDCGNLMPLI